MLEAIAVCGTTADGRRSGMKFTVDYLIVNVGYDPALVTAAAVLVVGTSSGACRRSARRLTTAGRERPHRGHGIGSVR
jgi:hypothetical protein